jgi:hypothetical protein
MNPELIRSLRAQRPCDPYPNIRPNLLQFRFQTNSLGTNYFCSASLQNRGLFEALNVWRSL